MRFAYLCCDFGVPIFGTKGSSVHVRENAEALRRLGHRVKIFSPNPGVEDENARGEDFDHVPLGGFAERVGNLLKLEETGQPAHLVTEWRRLIYSEYIQKTLLPTIAAFQPDLIYERYSLFAYGGVEMARQLRVPHVLEVNAPLSLEAVKYRQLVLKRTAEELERRILKGADALIVVSKALEDYAWQLGVPSDRITVLPNAVDPDRFNPRVSGEAVRALYALDEKRVIGFVGSLKPWHDLDTLLAAVNLLADADERVHLFVVGDGPRMEQLRTLGEGYVTCTGAVEHSQLPEFMAAMDVVAIPYSQEGDSYFSPLKLFEAMAMAKPIVGARVGQVAEMLVHGQNGLIYEPSNARDLATKIRQILEMSDRGTGLGAAARRSVLTTQTWEQNARRIVAVAQSLLETVRAS